MNNWVEAIILGAVQGATEWLPVSSEGVVTLIQTQLFNAALDQSLSYAIWLHLGTFFAAVIYFRAELLRLLPQIPTWIFSPSKMSAGDRTIANFLFWATLVTGIVGTPLLLFSLNLEIPGNIAAGAIGVLLIGTGLSQVLVSSLGRRSERDLNLGDGIIVGIAQGLASLPGLSRSGLTISTLLLRGFSETEAIRISFLMSIPVIFGAQVLLQLIELRNESIIFKWDLALLGMAAAAVVGWLTIAALVKIARVLPFWAFAIALGIVSLIAAFLV